MAEVELQQAVELLARRRVVSPIAGIITDLPVKVGELQVWDVVNSSHMDHPFHLHGFFFQVLSVNGEEPAFRSWEDVVNLPPKSTTRIAWMPDGRPGSWMYHCHILEHHAAGMMGTLRVG